MQQSGTTYTNRNNGRQIWPREFMAWNELITQVMKNRNTQTGGGEVTQGLATAGSHGRTNGGRSAMKPRS